MISHALIGGALFTFVLFMRDLGRILELVVRDGASLTGVAKYFSSRSRTPSADHPDGRAGRHPAWTQPARIRQRNHRDARCGHRRLTFCVASCRWSRFWAVESLLNTLYLAPKATEALLQLEDSLKDSQASFEVQPRVFYEDFRNYVLYVQECAAFHRSVANGTASSSPT